MENKNMYAYFEAGATDEDGKELLVKIFINGVEFISFEEYEKSHEAARRICAALNACKDMDTAALESEAPPKSIQNLADLREELSKVHRFFDTQKVSLVDGILQLGEFKTEPAYFIGTENGIEDTDAPPEYECTNKSMR